MLREPAFFAAIDQPNKDQPRRALGKPAGESKGGSRAHGYADDDSAHYADVVQRSPDVVRKPVPAQRTGTARPAATAQIGSDYAVTRTQWRNDGQAYAVVAASAVEHNDRAAVAFFHGIEFDTIGVIPEFPLRDLLTFERCKKRKAPRLMTRGLLNFGFRVAEFTCLRSTKRGSAPAPG